MTTGIILDLETTGLDHKTDKIIEIGILKLSLEMKRHATFLPTASFKTLERLFLRPSLN